MYNAPYQGVADDLAKYGRYGDSMLVHMNPIEVGILASLSPTGELTTNPVTGQKEAFLPFLAPLLGSFLGSSLLTGAGAGALGGLIGAKGLSSAAAGAIGSALASTAATGDLKEGIISGLTGFGLGKAFGAASDALKATAPAASSVPSLTEAASKALPNVSMDVLSQLSPADLKALAPAAVESGAQSVAANAAQTATSPVGAFVGELTKPGTFLPIYAGTSVTEGMRQQEELDRLMKEQGLSDEEAKRKYEEDARRAIETAQRLYPQMRPKGMAAGGQVEGYQVGGRFGSQPSYGGGISFDEQYGLNNMSGGFYDTQFGQTSPSDIQSKLRGTVSVAAPYASYGALDVGGSGYLPGIAPEFQYFRQPEEVYPQPPLTMGRGKGGGFGGYSSGYGSPYGGGYSSMPGGKGGGYSGFGGYGSPYGGTYGGGYGGYDMGGYGGFGGYGSPYGSGYRGGYGDLFSRYSSPYYGGYTDEYGLNQPGNEPGMMYLF